jgi:hypothetical protein
MTLSAGRRPYARLTLTLLLPLALARCSDSTDPDADDIREPTQLSILRLPDGHPPFFNDSVSFYARPGRSVEGKLYFANESGGRGEEWAVLKIDGQSLLARPDGTSFGPNDSVLIVMKVDEQSLVAVELRPSGLRFRTDQPAELKLDYDEVGEDLDGDGDDDEHDDEVEQLLSIWHQEQPGDPFVKVGSVKTEDARELLARLTGFSRFAIAY